MSHRDLVAAASRGDAEVVAALLGRGVDPDVPSPRGGRRRAIHGALAPKGDKTPGHRSCVRLLADAGADLTWEGQFQRLAPLRLAAAGGHPDLVQLLLGYEPPIDAMTAAAIHRPGPAGGADSEGRSPLTALAASRLWQADPAGALSTAERLLEDGATVEPGVEATRVRPLWWAIAWGRNLALIRLLLERGASAEGCLHDAAYHGRDDFIRLLVNHGADVDARNVFGLTPLLHVLTYKRYDSVRTLLDFGALTGARGGRGDHDALGLATATGAPPAVLDLLAG